MSVSPEFLGFVEELLAGFGPVRAKRMFGGAGIYADDVMFALVDDDVLYLKADDELVEALKAEGSSPWSYSLKRDGAARNMGYWRLPDAAADDPEYASSLARRAYGVALAKKRAKPARKAKVGTKRAKEGGV